MPSPTPVDAAADAVADLHCPLCEYNLRGLAQPRCPECGFTFDWDELRAAGRSRHPWLFEHGGRRNLPTLWTTWWWNRLPWAFWRAVTPVYPVRLGRLVGYWLTGGLVAVVLLLGPLPHGIIPLWAEFSGRSMWASPRWPHLDWLRDQGRQTWAQVRADGLTPDLIGPVLLVLAWPWLSAAALMVFRLSMRQARIGPAHVLRVAIYGCDFGLVVVLAVVALLPVATTGWSGIDGVPLVVLTLLCAAVATVRLTFAYARYLRFHRPLSTVLASQVLVALVAVTVLARNTDLSAMFR